MTDWFKLCYDWTVLKEGGWSDRSLVDDPGGKTMRGLTLKTYSAYLGRRATPTELRNISSTEHAKVFRQLFWKKCRCEKMIGPVAAAVFDTAIHSGEYRAIRILQEALKHYGHDIEVDGEIGSETLSALNATASQNLAIEMIIRRARFMTSLSNWHSNSRGWINNRIVGLWRHVENCNRIVIENDIAYERGLKQA